MAETVYLNDGTMECIFDDKDVFLERLLNEKLGSDAARCFRNYIDELLEEGRDLELQAAENERSADGYLQMCRDALEALDNIVNCLCSSKPDISKLLSIARNAQQDLYSNL